MSSVAANVLASGYTIAGHQHRLAAWAAATAARASSRCRFEVEQGVGILEATGFDASLSSPEQLPISERVDEAHRAWRETIVATALGRGLPFTHGVAAKLINVYLKARFVVAGHHDHPRVQTLQLRQAVPPLITRWEFLIGVKVERFFIQRMRTKWGSCSPCARSIRLNTDLAKKPPECLEYVIVHEMTHLLEPTHNARFVALMDGFMPKWQFHRQILNRLPVRHEDWTC